ncbi:MAG: J domain-containing protein [Nitrospinota bacterium]
MNGRDWYAVLGVPPGADAEKIKKAYRRLALECHPDRHPGDKDAEARFKEIVIAYEALSDPEKRAKYGRMRKVPDTPKPAGQFDEGWEEVFSQIFRTRAGEKIHRNTPEKGRGIDARLDITLEDAATGGNHILPYHRQVLCSRCRGTETDPEGESAECRLCGGAGEVRFRRGSSEVAIPCGACMGEGRIRREQCPECRGEGRIRTEESRQVKVHAAVNDGERILFARYGDEGVSDTGDLRVTIHVRPHKIFERSGRYDILLSQPINVLQAVMGGQIIVPTLHGQVKLRIPAGTRDEQVFRLRGKGLSRPAGEAGDQLVTVTLETPTRVGKKLRWLLGEVGRLSGAFSHPLKKRLLDKVKSFLR